MIASQLITIIFVSLFSLIVGAILFDSLGTNRRRRK